ncbi:MAG: RNA polymerase sigma factor [Gammaproteobacteria bacterium]
MRAAEHAARDAYGRLLATLSCQFRDVEAAQDALGDAFEKALQRWPVDGVPDAPVAWLLTAARRAIIDAGRHAAVVARGARDVLPLLDAAVVPPASADRRVELMLVCAHPDIDRRARAPLMLQTVLGLTAQRMGAAFAVTPAALGQRLARAKRAIREKKIPFDLPEDGTRHERLGDVLNALYAAFGTGWEDVTTAGDLRHGLAGEALWLCELVAQQFADHAEAQGLAALMMFSQSRCAARRSAQGRFIPLAEQDRKLWDTQMLRAADAYLARAAALGESGRFQLEAAIQSHHVRTPVNVESVALLYEGLVRVAPTLASYVGRAAALGEARGAAAGLAALAILERKQIASYQPYWAVKAHLHALAGQRPKAEEAYTMAIGLAVDPAVADYLTAQRAAIIR